MHVSNHSLFFQREDEWGAFGSLFDAERSFWCLTKKRGNRLLFAAYDFLPKIIHHHVLIPAVLIIRWHKTLSTFLLRFVPGFQFKTLWRAFDADFIVISSLVVRPFLRCCRLMSRVLKRSNMWRGTLLMREQFWFLCHDEFEPERIKKLRRIEGARRRCANLFMKHEQIKQRKTFISLMDRSSLSSS